MSQIDENQIHDRLKRLSQVEPTKEASDRTMRRVRDLIMNDEKMHSGRVAHIRKGIFISSIVKLAAAAVLMIGAGYIGGRLSAPEPLNVQELQTALESSIKSSLEPAIRQQLHDEFENRLQSALTADHDTLKQELARQVRADLETFAEQTLTTVGNLMDQRLMKFARMVEEARIKDRQHVAAAFDYMGSRFGNGLVTLATRTDDLLNAERVDSTPDVSDN